LALSIASLLAITAGAGGAATLTASAAGASTTNTSAVIITGLDSTMVGAEVQAAQGTVSASFPDVGGVAATVTPAQAAALSADPTLTVTPNTAVSFGPASPSDQSATPSTSSFSAANSSRPPAAVFPQVTGATRLAGNGIDGTGVNVAVLDTGVDALPDFAGRLAGGVDLSGEGNPFADNFGHGTFVAGLVAGDGASSGGAYIGEAPGAGLVAVKVAGASGATDLATVLSGIEWTIDHKAALHIGVLNLSLGIQPVTSTMLNPLDRAVEAAWRAGIVVVVAAGNAGPFNGTILSPGDDPLVVTAGAVDDNGTVGAADDSVPDFSSVGPTNTDGWIKPDIVASGRSVISLRAPGSTIDTNYPSARIGTGNFVGSGTSFSSAITSGAAALILEAHPDAQPDGVKARLIGTAQPGPLGNPFVDGHGSLDVAKAANAAPASVAQYPHPWMPPTPGGTVSLQRSWAVSAWNPANWHGSQLNGIPWNGTGWENIAWDQAAWNDEGPATTGTGSSWGGLNWTGSAWNGFSWSGNSWTGSSWSGSSWSGNSWSGNSWSGNSWSGSSWSGSSWSGSSWSGSSWS
jgi:serine protease AprX